MRTCIRASCFLILFTIFSISILLSSSVAQTLGQTFESYQPPAIACEKAGAWAPVDSNGNGIKQGTQVQFGIFTCAVASPGPGEAGKFNGIPERDPNSYRYVFANTQQVGLPGTDATYNFNTGIWTTSAGQFRDGINIASPIGSPSLPVVQGTYGSPSLPVVQGIYGSPPGQGLSPSQSALEAAKRAKQEAEQQVTTAQSALEQANAARVAAEEQLASAQTALKTATAAEQAALEANAEQLQVAEQAQKDAEQQLASAQTTLDSVNTKLQELEQQIADARTKVAEANDAKRLAEQALAKAVNEVRKIKGEPALPVVGGDYSGPPGDSGRDPSPLDTISSIEAPLLRISETDGVLATFIRNPPTGPGGEQPRGIVSEHMAIMADQCLSSYNRIPGSQNNKFDAVAHFKREPRGRGPGGACERMRGIWPEVGKISRHDAVVHNLAEEIVAAVNTRTSGKYELDVRTGLIIFIYDLTRATPSREDLPVAAGG
jgi:hypothetical protein